MTSRGHTGRIPASRRPLSPQKFPTPRGPGCSGLPRPGGTVGRARSHSLPSSPPRDKDITVSIPARPQVPGPFITARRWDGGNYWSHWLSSVHCFRQELRHRCQDPLQEPGKDGRGSPVGGAALCHALPRHAPRDPDRKAAARGSAEGEEAWVGSANMGPVPPGTRQS